jgi:hypothetical protein
VYLKDVAGAKVAGETKGEKEVKTSEEKAAAEKTDVHTHTKSR